MWKATTSALILEHMEGDGEKDDVQKSGERLNRDLSKRVLDSISPFVRNADEYILDSLGCIIENSIALDQEVCRQCARVDWVFSTSQVPLAFDPDCMAAGHGEVAPRPGNRVGVVRAPGLKKRGKSTGEDFEMESLLLKMDVACMPRPRDPVL